jgi:non-ribosomal peptide synthetase component E (peptide arylation enzyme)
MLIWNNLKEHAASRGDKLALACGDASLSRAEFMARAENLAHTWLGRGICARATGSRCI